MAFDISIKSNVREVARRLDRIQKKQLPFAISVALNKTAEFTATNLNNDTRRYFENPTPFTQRAFGFKKSNKRNLTARVFARRTQNEYLQYQVFGGIKRPQGRALVLPENIRLNRYGNIPRNSIKRLLARRDTFSGVVRGVAGIWQRGHYTRSGRFSSSSKSRGSSLRLLVAYEPSATYVPRYPYSRLTRTYVDKAIEPFFDAALKQARRTAR